VVENRPETARRCTVLRRCTALAGGRRVVRRCR
jgi:hypothetical protein